MNVKRDDLSDWIKVIAAARFSELSDSNVDEIESLKKFLL